jgi:hypothetical protein
MNDREGEEMSRTVYEMIYARLQPKRIIDEFGKTQADYMRSLRTLNQKKRDGHAEIRTQDLRRVKATS